MALARQVAPAAPALPRAGRPLDRPGGAHPRGLSGGAVHRPQPRRWLPLVAWLFAVPHLIILGALTGAIWSYQSGDTRTAVPLSVAGAVVLVAGFALLFTGRNPGG